MRLIIAAPILSPIREEHRIAVDALRRHRQHQGQPARNTDALAARRIGLGHRADLLIGGIFDGDVELVIGGRVGVGFVFLVLGDVHATPAGVKAFCRGGLVRVCWILAGAVPVEALGDGAGGQGVGFSGEVPGFEDAGGGPDDFLVFGVAVVDEDDGGDVGVAG